MLVRNTENIGIYMQSVLKKMTISSLWGPKRPQEFLLRLNFLGSVKLIFTKVINCVSMRMCGAGPHRYVMELLQQKTVYNLDEDELYRPRVVP